MLKDKGDTVVEEEKVEETIVSESEPETPTMSLEDVQKELELTKAELGKAKALASEHERNVTRKANELQKRQDLEGRIDSLTKKVETQIAMLADVMDRESYEEEEPKPKQRRSEQYLARLKEDEDKRNKSTEATEEQRVNFVAGEIIRLTTPNNMQLDESPELMKAHNLWLTGKFDEALQEVKRVVQPKETPKESEDELKARLKEEARKELLAERGELDTVTVLSSGAGGSFQDITARYIKGEVSDEDFSKAREKFKIN